MNCKICDSPADEVFKKQVLFKYDVAYFRCKACGFVFTEEPYWLDEAYGKYPVSPYDVSSPSRAMMHVRTVERFMRKWVSPDAICVDYGGGTGMLSRLLRDRGYNFYRFDPHCENIYMPYFDWSQQDQRQKVGFVTSLEVFEHFVEPVAEVKKVTDLSDLILFSTGIAPEWELEKWFYLIPECGQHVALWSKQSLEKVARMFGMHFYTNGINLHVFSRTPLKVDMSEIDGSRVGTGIATRIFRRTAEIFAPDALQPPIPGHRQDDYEYVLQQMRAGTPVGSRSVN